MALHSQACPVCGGELPFDAPEGLCPRCLLAGVVEELGMTPDPGPSAHDELPRRFGDYELEEELARGGMGVIYRARQLTLGRWVALKMILPERLVSSGALGRFRGEALAAAALQHRNIVPVYEAGVVSGRPYFTMELVSGRSLADTLRERPLPPMVAARYLHRIARAMEHAHGQGIVHRDLKPSNVIIDGDDEPRVTDFGLARRLQDDVRLTGSGTTLGTPGYMAPEQVTTPGGDGPPCDIHAMGAVLYEMVTGRPPFQADTVGAILHMVVGTDPVPPRRLNPSVPRDIETLCLRCLEKDPERRPCSAGELAAELERHLAGLPIRSRPVGLVERTVRWCRRNPAAAVWGAVALLLMLILAVGSPLALRQIHHGRQRAVELAAGELRQRLRAEETVRRMAFARAEELLAHDKAADGVAILASLARKEPANEVVIGRLVHELSCRSFALPVLPPLAHPDAVFFAEFNPDGTRLLTAGRDNAVRLWDATAGRAIGSPVAHRSGLVRSGEFEGPTRPVVARFSPDGRRVATGSVDGRVRVWNATDGGGVTPWLALPAGAVCVRFSPDSLTVAAGGRDGSLLLWDAGSGAPVLVLTPHASPVNAIDFSPDGRHLLTASEDGLAKVVDLRRAGAVACAIRHPDGVRSAVFSPDGRQVATAGGAQAPFARVWDSLSGEPVTPPLVHEGILNSAEFSPDGGRLLTVSFDRSARIWDVRSGMRVGRPLTHAGVVRSGRFSGDGQRVVTASEDRTARVWDAHSGEPLTEPLRHEGPVWAAGFDPEGARVVTASSDGTAQVWDVRPGGAVAAVLPAFRKVKSVQWSADGRWLLHTSGAARIWNPATAGLRHGVYFQHGGETLWSAFSPDGRSLVTTADDGTARLWDAGGGVPRTGWLRHEAAIRHACFSPDGRRLATASDDRTARLWDASSGVPLCLPLPHGDAVFHCEFDPAGRLLLTAGADGAAHLWEVPSGRAIPRVLSHGDDVLTARFSPDGRRIVTASRDRTGRIWETASGGEVCPALVHRGALTSARFSPDGRRVLTASEDGTARVWDAATGVPVTDSLAHEARILAADFSPDGERVATGSADGVARVWSVRSGQPLSSFLTHGGPVNSLQFSPDGRWLATASSDWCVRVWSVPLVETAAFSAWLPDLAESVAGRRMDGRRGDEVVPVQALLQWREQVDGRMDSGAGREWARWFFEDRSARALSSGARLTVAQYRKLWTGRARVAVTRIHLAQVRQQFHRCPSDPEACESLARQLAAESVRVQFPAALGESGHLERRARWLRSLAVADMRRELEASVAAGDGVGGLAAADRVLQRAPEDPATWRLRATLLERAGDVEATLASLERLLEVERRAGSAFHRAGTLHSDFLSRHPELEVDPEGAGWRLKEGAKETRRRAHGIANRPAGLPGRLVDLTPHYRTGLEWSRPIPLPYAPGFRSPPSTPWMCRGIDFDVRGLLEVAAGWHEGRFPELPCRVGGIHIGRSVHRLHFLHTGVGEDRSGTLVGCYVVHFADGEVAEVPIVYGQDLLGWTTVPGAVAGLEPCLAWEAPLEPGSVGRLYLSSWENPRPGKPIDSVDLESFRAGAAIVLFGLTIE